MAAGENLKAHSSAASASQGLRTFEKLFPPSKLPPLHFEPVVCSTRAIGWAVLLESEICFVPLKAANTNKVVQISVNSITAVDIDKTDHHGFVDSKATQRSAKVVVRYTQDSGGETSKKPGALASLGRLFGRASPSASPEPGGAEGSAREAEKGPASQEAFWTFEEGSRVHHYLDLSWQAHLQCQLYGWTKREKLKMSPARIKELYTDLRTDLGNAATLQSRVDLLDELAHAIRFSKELKQSAITQSPSLITWITAQLRKFSVDKWKLQPEVEGLTRQESLQYVTVLLETLRNLLFQSWKVFHTHDGRDLLEGLMDTRQGALAHLLTALWVPMVDKADFEGKDTPAALEVLHSVMAVLYELLIVTSELYADNSAAAVNRQKQVMTQMLGGTDKGHLGRRMGKLIMAMKHVMMKMAHGALRSITLHHYAYVLLHLCQTPGPMLDVIREHHAEDVKFIFPQFAKPRPLAPGETLHPVDSKICSNFTALLRCVISDPNSTPSDA